MFYRMSPMDSPKLGWRIDDTLTLAEELSQVGVDVMAFAKNGEAFDNVSSSCIQCGICIDVCPMDVLAFDDAPRAAFAAAAKDAPHTAAAAAKLRGRALPVVQT